MIVVVISWMDMVVGMDLGEPHANTAASPKSMPYGADAFPGGFGVHPVPLTSSMSIGEILYSSYLYDDGTCMSCSFLKASFEDCLWWWHCWWLRVAIRWHVGEAAWHLPYRRQRVSATRSSRIWVTDVSGWTGARRWRSLAAWRR